MSEILDKSFNIIYVPPKDITLREATENYIAHLKATQSTFEDALSDPEWGTEITAGEAFKND